MSKKITQKEQLEILHRFVMLLHLSNWTYNEKMFARLLRNAGAYSYCRTNSNPGNERQERKQRKNTLLNLTKYEDMKNEFEPLKQIKNIQTGMIETNTNFVQTLPNSHFWTDINQLITYLEHMKKNKIHIDIDYLINGLKNTLSQKYNLHKS